MNWLKSNWFLVVAFAAVTTAWGQQQQKITTIEQTLVVNASLSEKIVDIKLQAARQDEQLKTIKESQLNTEKLLRDLLRGQQMIRKEIK